MVAVRFKVGTPAQAPAGLWADLRTHRAKGGAPIDVESRPEGVFLRVHLAIWHPWRAKYQ